SKTTQDVPQGEARWGWFVEMVVDTEKVARTDEYLLTSRRSPLPRVQGIATDVGGDTPKVWPLLEKASCGA
ncbi:MAG: hypothetical protein ACUVTG_17020, partial [Candidatus Oleimicrobiaceae bacterium]